MLPSHTTALERLMRPLSGTLTRELARALAGVEADAETQTRYDDLAGRHTAGRLSPQERAEFDAIVEANTLLGILKVEAHAWLAQHAAD